MSDIEKRCAAIADQVEPDYRVKRQQSCTSHSAKRWNSAYEAARLVLAAAAPPPSTPRSPHISEEMLEAALKAAYKRGAEWQAQNADPKVMRLGTAEGLDKAAYDYADKTLGAPTSHPHLVGGELPADIVESLLSIGLVEWGQTHKQNDGKHIDDLEDTLRLTRQHFGIEDRETAIHGLYLEGTSVVLAHTGMSPNSPQHARILAGAWNQLVELAKTQRAALSAEVEG